MRLDHYLRDRGYDRARTRQLIVQGRITVNGRTAEQAAMDCGAGDTVLVDGQAPGPAVRLTIMLNKPAGYVTATASDTDATVMDLLPAAYRDWGLFPVGRLDKASEGLLLLTNDGTLCQRILRPETHLPKTYFIRVGRPFPADTETRFRTGIVFPDGTPCRPAEITISTDRLTALVTITEGKTHQVRRMAAACGVRVGELKRLSIGALALDPALAPGAVRELTEDELALLQA